jgi:hypothetical protein
VWLGLSVAGQFGLEAKLVVLRIGDAEALAVDVSRSRRDG